MAEVRDLTPEERFRLVDSLTIGRTYYSSILPVLSPELRERYEKYIEVINDLLTEAWENKIKKVSETI